MTLQTSATGADLLEELAQLFDRYASDSEEFAKRGWSKRENASRAKVWRQAAEDCRSIRIVPAEVAA